MRRLSVILPLLVAAAVALGARVPTSPGAASSGTGPHTAGSAATGQQLWLSDCAICHDTRAGGTNRGPDIAHSGPAAVDFMMRTGRMPLSRPDARLERRTVRYSSAQIDSVVAYTSRFIDGPAVPKVDVSHASLSRGNQLYLVNCAACHQSAGAGGALAYGDVAPALGRATPTETIEALRTGPGRMPPFDRSTLDDHEATDIARYVQELRHPEDRGGWSIGHLGPVPEGLVAWALGLGSILVAVRWLGTRVKPTSKG